ncbi:8-amino-7-oxononanoate synthase [Qipengyuania qiaonensis]|uniref:8-amino-7-oxononanoate synthase n=1 Tax=Qipengyuania qiaonensis TaxID=2867240 RepID=A0ABS7JAS0_9SPHN|nr:8-amino-7-oxononanoate synthase [Qipengyuania qiaonensis]MBX7483139.1 8-amino-7-oxononanoate synthase [Qipengyuania qiaonensis]
MQSLGSIARAFSAQQDDLTSLARQSRRRSLIRPQGADFSSNDYLALAGDARLKRAIAAAMDRGVPAGAGGSRLLRGNHEEHELLEVEAARFFGSESALFLANGYTANSAMLATLPQRGDAIFYDTLIHASAHEGMRLSRAERVAVPHNDLDAFADGLARWRERNVQATAWIAVETLYSMDGDRAPLRELADLADRHGAILLADDAHATGVFGEGGRGLAYGLDGRANAIVLRTCGKALGSEGALLCGPRVMRDHLINRARSFIFSTAPSPLIAACVREALRVVEDEPERRVRLAELVAYAGERLAPLGATISGSQIMPLVIGDDARTMQIAQRLREAGLDVRGIRPPTVPAGTSRLRISLTLNIGKPQIDALADTLSEILA